MQIIERVSVPTGDILIVQGERGRPLECLSIGDYGKEKNLKADFLGLTDEINGVPHGDLLPLETKWVITVSTQYGCSTGCTFCDVPKVGRGINASLYDIMGQIKACQSLHPEVKRTDRLNVHFARMGEPTWNPKVLIAARYLFNDNYESHVHPVVSTMLPRENKALTRFLKDWMGIKNNLYDGEAGLQLSINSTNEAQRRQMFNGNAVTLEEAGAIVSTLPAPLGRKITLNFALNDTYEVDPGKLLPLFPPDRFLVKLTPMHMTTACRENAIQTSGGYDAFYPYRFVEQALKDAGYDVIVFVPSHEEDESRITCGNAILSDRNITEADNAK